jgi:hypothetical protein
MPLKIISPAFTASRLSAGVLLIILSIPAPDSGAQSPYSSQSALGGLQFELPWDGPGAAIYNPAALAETKRFDARAAFYGTASGKAGTRFLQGATRVYGGLYAGLADFRNSSSIDGSNALYQVSADVPMIAYGWSGDTSSGFGADVGASLPIRRFDAFGAVKSTVVSGDIGLHLSWPAFPDHLGRIHSGLAAQNVFSGKVKLTDDNGNYEAQRASYLITTFWNALGGMVDLYSDTKLQTLDDSGREGPSNGSAELFSSWGAEIRPIPMVGVKVERTWLKYWTAGLVLRIPIPGGVNLGVEADMSHDMLGPQDEGRGLLWSLALNVGM